jgi:hypothetical protein
MKSRVAKILFALATIGFGIWLYDLAQPKTLNLDYYKDTTVYLYRIGSHDIRLEMTRQQNGLEGLSLVKIFSDNTLLESVSASFNYNVLPEKVPVIARWIWLGGDAWLDLQLTMTIKGRNRDFYLDSRNGLLQPESL